MVIVLPYCIWCGKEIPEQARFCYYCGKSLDFSKKEEKEQTVEKQIEVPITPSATKGTDSKSQTILEKSIAEESTQLPEKEIEVVGSQEKEIWHDDKAEVIISKSIKKGTGTKLAVAALTGAVGYLVWGRDKTKKTEFKGKMALTNRRLLLGDINKGSSLLPVDEGIIGIQIMGTFTQSLNVNIVSNDMDVEFELKSKNIDGWKKAFLELPNASIRRKWI